MIKCVHSPRFKSRQSLTSALVCPAQPAVHSEKRTSVGCAVSPGSVNEERSLRLLHREPHRGPVAAAAELAAQPAARLKIWSETHVEKGPRTRAAQLSSVSRFKTLTISIHLETRKHIPDCLIAATLGSLEFAGLSSAPPGRGEDDPAVKRRLQC